MPPSKLKFIIILILVVIVSLCFFVFQGKKENTADTFTLNNQTNMKITSKAFREGGTIPSQYTCDGINLSPPLSFSSVPSSAKSLALIMDDHDVPKSIKADGIWDHLVVFNIPPTTTEIKEGEAISGTYGSNSSGKQAYSGPCPPDREHRYNFYLYALDTVLSLNKGATKSQVLEAVASHIIEEAKLVGTYARKI